MTAEAMRAIAEARGFAAQLVLSAVLLPLLPLLLVADAAISLLRRQRVAAALRQRSQTCPRGHEVTLFPAAWSCPTCSLSYEGHGFEPCPHCGAVSYAVQCACSLPVLNPLWEAGDAD